MGRTRDVIRASGLGPAIKLLVAAVVFMWGLELLDWLVSWELDKYGIRPRTIRGLPGILASPFLHGGFEHLMANTIPLLVLGLLISLRGVQHLIEVTLFVMIVGGLAVWAMGKGTSDGGRVLVTHIGASGVVFGYFGYLLLRGIFDKSVKSLLVGVFVLLLYGGLIWGVLPTQEGVSWEAHLFGFIAGVIAAKLLANRTTERSLTTE